MNNVHSHKLMYISIAICCFFASTATVKASDNCVEASKEGAVGQAGSCTDVGGWLVAYEAGTQVIIGFPGPMDFNDAPALHLGQSICNGSWVSLRNEGAAEITVAGRNEPLHLTFDPDKDNGNTRCVKIETDSSGEASNISGLFDDLVSIFASWAPGHYSRSPDNFVMRGPEDPIDVAILPSEVNKLAAGARTVALLWSGGQPPYRLSISKDDVEIFATDAEKHALSTTEIDFQIGSYALVISDANGETLERRIEVVAEAPAAPERLVATIMNDRFSAVVEAGWLSTLEDGSWRWEAMLQVLPYVREDPAAAGLTRALLNGDHPVSLD